MLAGLIISIACSSAAMSVHVIVARGGARPASALRVIMMIGISASLLLTALVHHAFPHAVLTQGNLLVAEAWTLLSFVAIFSLYIPFYYVIAASVSVRTILLLLDRCSQSCSEGELFAEFASEKVAEDRLRTMAENGFVHASGNVYALARKGKALALGFSWLKRLWHLEPGG